MLLFRNILSSAITRKFLPEAPGHILTPQVKDLGLLSFTELILLYLLGPFDKELLLSSNNDFAYLLRRLRNRMKVNLSIRIAEASDLYDIAEHDGNKII